MESGVGCLVVFGVWCLVFGVWCFGVLVFDVFHTKHRTRLRGMSLSVFGEGLVIRAQGLGIGVQGAGFGGGGGEGY